MGLRPFRAWIPAASLALAFVALLPPLGCQTLAPLATDTCGNGVVDAAEDCDVFPLGDYTSCRPPGSVGACRFDCTRDGSGTGPACPGGWRCGLDGICRVASGNFAPPRVIGTGATQIALADFDVDGRQDVFLTDSLDLQGVGSCSVRFFDDRLDLSKTTALGEFRVSPAVISPSFGSPSLALVPSGSGLAFLRGRPDRTFTAAVQSSFSPKRPVLGVVRSDAGAFAILVPGPVPGGPSVWLGYDGTDFTQQLPGGAWDGSARFIHAKLTPNARCESIAYFETLYTIAVLPLCTPEGGWNTRIPPARIAAASGMVPDGLVFADIDLDGTLDLVANSDAGLVVAYGEARSGDSVSLTEPTSVPGVFTTPPFGTLLAAGDLNGDRVADYVSTNGVMTSQVSGATTSYTNGVAALGRWWSARIADLDGDGAADLLASSQERPSLTFIKGGAGPLKRAAITLPGIADQMVVGDFDNDLLNDVAFREQTNGNTFIGVLFGHAGLPGPAVTALAVDTLRQLDVAAGSFNAHGEPSPTRLFSLSQGSRISYVAASSVRQILSPTVISTDDPIFAVAPSSPGSDAPFALALALVTRGQQARVALHAIRADGGGPVDLADLDALTPVDAPPIGALATGDVDADGIDDAVVLFAADPYHDARLEVLLGRTAAPWTRISREVFGQIDASARMALEDLDGDGALDLIIHARSPGASQIVVRWNDGSGGFPVTNDIVLGNNGPDVANGLALANVGLHVPRALVYGSSIVSHSDIIVATFDASRAVQRRYLAQPNDSAPLTSVAAGDVDGDGVDDVVYVHASGLVFLRGIGTQP